MKQIQKKTRGRGPVKYLNRRRKAQMIAAILRDHLAGDIDNYKILDIGSGNGGISEYFAESNSVYALDIEDNRHNPDNGIPFSLVNDEQLPFENDMFDIVLSHHVIEHVEDQNLHLSEIRRVLKLDGIAYMATPNKSSPIMEGHVGNDLVLRYHQMHPLFKAAKFNVFEYGLKVFTKPDKYFCENSAGKFLPAILIRPLRRFFPSHMFILAPVDD